MFCMPARGQEKGDVERTVFALERRFATPVPAAPDLDGLNRHLLGCCLKERERIVGGRDRTIGQMFEEERLHAPELPARPFDACIQHIRQADKYQTVLFDEVRYSVPRHVAFEPVTVKAYVEQIVLVHKGQVVARHRRGRTPGEQILDPAHFLAALSRKPAYLDHTKLFKELKLPPVFAELRRRFEAEHGQRTGTRHYIRVLQLLGRHTAGQVARAIEGCLHRHGLRAEFIEQKLATPQAGAPAALSPVGVTLHLSEWTPIRIPTVTVPPPDLRRFDQLLIHRSESQGEEDVREERAGDVAEAQPQDAASADDAGGVRPALA
jgi:hypothetical protein